MHASSVIDACIRTLWHILLPFQIILYFSLSLSLCVQFKRKVVAVLYFTALLVEHSYTRNIYNSTEVLYVHVNVHTHMTTLDSEPCSEDILVHCVQIAILYHCMNRSNISSSLLSHLILLQHLCTLLASSDMDVVLAVLNLLYVFR